MKLFSEPGLKAIFLRFGDDFWVILGARIVKKSIKNLLKFQWNFNGRNWRLEARFGRLERPSAGREPCGYTRKVGLVVPKKNLPKEEEEEEDFEGLEVWSLEEGGFVISPYTPQRPPQAPARWRICNDISQQIRTCIYMHRC